MGFALTIEDYYPLRNETEVERNTSIQISFNRDIKESSIQGNFLIEKKVDTTFVAIAGSIVCANKKITFTPTVALDASTIYRVTIVGDSTKTSAIDGLQDIFGEGMIGTLQYTFTTNSNALLGKLTLTKPTANTKFTSVPAVGWEAIENATYELELSTATDFSVDLWSTTVLDGSTNVTPGIALVDGTYFYRGRYILDGETSLWSEPTRFFIEELLDDEVPIEDYLEIIRVTPANNSYNLPITTSFSMVFDENITEATVKLVELPQTESTIQPTITNATITCSPTLQVNRQYRLVITAKSATKALMEDYEYNFTTTYSPLFIGYNDVVSELGSLALRISPHIIYLGIKDASIYAEQLRTSVENANTNLTPTNWEDIANLPLYITQYVRYQAAFNALTSFYIDKAAQSGEMRQLADFVVQEFSDSDKSIGRILDMLKAKAKPWLDQIMGFGVIRGYAKPVSVTKGENNSYLEFQSDRSTWKES